MKSLRMLIVTCLAISIISPISQVFAQDKADEANPIEVLAKQNELLLQSTKNEEELKFVYATRIRDGYIRAATYTRDLVSGAVDACSEAQPDMSKALNDRFSDWKETIEPLLKDAETFVEDGVNSQKNPMKLKLIENLKLVRKAADYTNAKQEKEYVTDKEACQYLLDNMDVTEEQFKEQLGKIKEPVPFPEQKTDE